MADLPVTTRAFLEERTDAGSRSALVARNVPRAHSDGPRLEALLACYGVLRRIVEEHRHLRDQAALATRPDLDRPGLLKAQEPQAPLTVEEAT